MKALIAGVLAGLLLVPTLAGAQPSIREEQIQFRKGESGATLKGSIKGDQIVDYKLRAATGQSVLGMKNCTWGTADKHIKVQFVADKVALHSAKGLK